MSDAKPDTIIELEAFARAIEGTAVAVDGMSLDAWIAKIRAHVEADELFRKSIETRALMGTGVLANRSFGKMVARADAARLKADLMPPVRICGVMWAGQSDVVCRRAPKHGGEHCPIPDGACGVDHGR